MRPRHVLVVAKRELLATIFTKGFLIGALAMPLVILLISALIPLLLAPEPTRGSLAILDRTGQVTPLLEARLAQGLSVPGAGMGAGASATFEVRRLDAAVDMAAEVERIRQDPSALALLDVPAEGLEGASTYELWLSPRVDLLLRAELSRRIADAIVDARLAAHGHDVGKLRALMEKPEAHVRTVRKEGPEEADEVAALLLPGAFMFLVWIASFTAGQLLLTTLVEEKSSRVMEVLLSALDPTEILAGKILGQTLVGLFVLAVYSVIGASTLVHFGLGHLFSPPTIALLFVFFLCAMVSIGSVMAAIGSVVEDMRSAQSLLAPVMFVVTLPLLLWMPISRSPDAGFAVGLSYAPLVGPFVTVLRNASAEPPSTAALALAIAVAIGWALLFVRGAGRVFEVGVLFYGKPPSLGVLLRWLRGK